MSRPRYTLDKLLAEAKESGQYPLPPEQREWVDTPAVGREWPACETLEGKGLASIVISGDGRRGGSHRRT
ncbi:TPA: hypothetical protein ND476_003857 [Enterobacter asburiae]|nr:hypothetical protein [Enterobacter asburiae]